MPRGEGASPFKGRKAEATETPRWSAGKGAYTDPSIEHIRRYPFFFFLKTAAESRPGLSYLCVSYALLKFHYDQNLTQNCLTFCMDTFWVHFGNFPPPQHLSCYDPQTCLSGVSERLPASLRHPAPGHIHMIISRAQRTSCLPFSPPANPCWFSRTALSTTSLCGPSPPPHPYIQAAGAPCPLHPSASRAFLLPQLPLPTHFSDSLSRSRTRLGPGRTLSSPYL